MSHRMKAFCLALVLIFVMVGISFGTNMLYDSFKQKTDEEKRAELVSLLKSEDLLKILSPEDLANVLKPLWKSIEYQVKSDGKYDSDYSLVPLAGFEPAMLEDFQRAVVVVGFNKQGRAFFSNIAMGLVYEEKYVVAPLQLFYFRHPQFGPIPAWDSPEIKIKAYLLPDPRKDEGWQTEELGTFYVNEKLFQVVIERVDPIISAKSDYTLGEYKDLSVGDALYALSQANGRITIEFPKVGEIYTDKEDRKLFGVPGDLLFNELGGAAFAIRDGKPELVGLLTVMGDAVWGEEGSVYVYYVDFQETRDFIEKEIKTK